MILTILFLVINVILIVWFIFHMFNHDNEADINHIWHRKWWVWTLLAFWIMFTIGGFGNLISNGVDDDDDYDEPDTEEVAKPVSHNLPGQKINAKKATKHEFYWTSKSHDGIRYFVNDDKKITAIKVVIAPSDPHNTDWCQQLMAIALDDNNLKFGNDKADISDATLSDEVKYNIYSPAYKKWYWLNWNDVDGKKVSSFSIYPGKNKDAE